MISNPKLAVSIHDDPPILICADLQTEYLTEGRRHVIDDAEAITARCRELMTLWRGNLWPIIHLKRIAQAAWFNPASNLTDWIAELKDEAEVKSSAPLWWRDMCFWTQTSDGRKCLQVNLVNPPKAVEVMENPRSEINPPVCDITVSCSPVEGQ